MEREVFTPNFLIVLLWIGFGKLITIGLFTFICNLPSKRQLRVYDIEIKKEQVVWELKASWLVLTDPIVLALLAWFRLIKFAPESPANILFTIAVFFVWAEVWFYWTHRLMHNQPLLWKIHRHHHLSKISQPLTAASFSFVEKFVFYTCGWLLFLSAVSWFVPISLYGIVAFYSYYFFTSPIAHSNTELSAHLLGKLPLSMGNIIGTATGHAIHHVQSNVNFGFITTVLDRVFGTYQTSVKTPKKFGRILNEEINS